MIHKSETPKGTLAVIIDTNGPRFITDKKDLPVYPPPGKSEIELLEDRIKALETI